MKNLFPLAAIAALAACNQSQDAEPTPEEVAICEAFDANIVDLQKRHSAELGEAILMSQMRAQGRLDPAAGDPGELARFSMLQFEARLNNLFALMESNGCDLPTEPVEGVVYSQAASRCLQARASGDEEGAVGACNRENWQPNPPAETAAETEAEPADSETAAAGE